jgi:hypothetical protein
VAGHQLGEDFIALPRGHLVEIALDIFGRDFVAIGRDFCRHH